ncbi:MAG: hypothetical protein IPG67_14160 [Acidobacteria bacterium]|nr:hypothetical protein [Acidobacteriota bacterium]
MKSLARVNPSTLAMEFDLSLMNYTGRNGNSLPVGLRYSSKLWRMESGLQWWYWENTQPKYVTDIYARFAERSASGWTSSLVPPRIEDDPVQLYTQEGLPWSPNIIDVAGLDTSWQNTLHGFSANLLEPCGTYCNHWVYNCPGGGYFCTLAEATISCSNYVTNYCNDGPVFSDPPPIVNLFYIKRLQVAMPDGSMREFRASDTQQSCGTNQAVCEPDLDGVYLAVDGSGLKLDRGGSGSTLYMPNGSRYVFPVGNGGEGTFATEFLDPDGNRMSFERIVADGMPTTKWTDSLGRQIVDAIPHNWLSQTQTAETRIVEMPGLGDGKQTYKLKWDNLKPIGCEDLENQPECTNDSRQVGALEDLNEKLYYETPYFCRGSVSDTDPEYPNDVLFPEPESGIRLCNSFGVLRDLQGQPILDENNLAQPVSSRFNPVVLSEVELPNGKKYVFKYNRYGEVTKIVYPAGSYETFEYHKITPLNGGNSAAYDQTNRGVKERRLFDADNALQQRWQYFAVLGKITTIAPKGDDALGDGIRTERAVYSQWSDGGNFGFSSPTVGMPLDEKTFDENNNLISRTLNEFITKDHSIASRDPRVKRTVSIAIENGQALATLSEKEYDETGSSDAEHFSHLNAKRSKSHHFRHIPLSLAHTGTLQQIASYFNSSTVATLSETDYLYDADYKARGIPSLPIESRSLNPADNSLLAKTQTKYDNLVPSIVTGYPQGYTTENYGLSNFDCGLIAANKCWIDPNTPYRGRPTTSRVWDSDNNTWIETHTRYDIFGNAVAARDAAGNETLTLFEDTTSKPYRYAYPTRVDISAPDPTNTHGTDQGSFSTSTYDLMTGLPLTATDEFGQTTATEYTDPLLRPTRAYAVNFTAPESQTIYDDDARTVKVRKQIDSTNWDEATTYMDTLGRTVKTVAKDSQGDVIVKTKYDSLGRVQMVSNPYRQGETELWSLIEYDSAGRTKQSREPVAGQNPSSPTGNILGTTTYDISTAPGYIGTVVMTTDAALKKSRSITNALGQLIVVEEPDHTGNLPALPQPTPVPTPSPNPSPYPSPTPHGQCISPVCPENFSGGEYPSYATFYDYNAQGKMVKVTQGVQSRYFKYDSLGRLIRVRQPEQEINATLDLADPYNTSGQWTAGFAYDTLGNVVRATDANGVNIINEYDKAGRVIRRCYTKPTINTSATNCASVAGNDLSTDTPSVSYFYDGIDHVPQQTPYNFAKGKLTKVTSSVSETRNELFDNFGRVTRSSQTTDGNTYTSKYTYNFAGALIEEEYPSGRKVKNEFEADGDLASVTSRKTANGVYTPYVSNFSYTASGGISQMKLGNGRWETAKFNTRMQVTELGLGTNVADANLWKTNYEYGELDSNGTTDPAKNTGNIAKQILTVPGTNFIQAYKYDSLYRITEAKETTGTNTTPNWIQNWGYDRYGNRTGFSQNIAGNTAASNPAIDQNTNRFTNLTDFAYDKNGNITRDLSPNSQLRTFVFNGDNKQTEVKDATGTTVGQYYYDGEGKRVKKYILSTGETTIFVYSSGKLVAEYSTVVAPASVSKVAYTTTDHLGSPRVITDALGQVSSRRDFMPFGEDLNVGVGNRTGDAGLKYSMPGDNVRQKFTGYQKDDETQLDFAEARMYENRYGRFTAVDPLLASGKSANPQTFNRFIYVGNNPIAITDPSGLEWGRKRNTSEGAKFDYYYQWFEGKPGEGWEAVDFGGFGNNYLQINGMYEGDNHIGTVYLNRFSGGYLTQAQYGGRMAFAMFTQNAFGHANDFMLGHGKGLYNFAAGTLNSPVTMPILPFATPFADTSIGGIFGIKPPVPTLEYYGALQNGLGYGTQGTLTIASLVRGVTGLRAGSSANLPTLVIDHKKYPQLAENIWHAQQAGHSRILTWGGNSSINRSAATKGIPEGILSVDEYPFAGTLEGGKGAWIGHIAGPQNSAQGGLITQFRLANNIKAGDRFNVCVINFNGC